MVKVYGVSDDLVEIEGSKYAEDEIDCFERNVRIWFDDGAIIRASYSDGGIWRIYVEHTGTGNNSLAVCHDEDADIYSDIYRTDAEIVSHDVIV